MEVVVEDKGSEGDSWMRTVMVSLLLFDAWRSLLANSSMELMWPAGNAGTSRILVFIRPSGSDSSVDLRGNLLVK